MLEDHYLSIGGGLSRSLADWGFSGASYESRGDGTDTLTLEAVRTPSDPALFDLHTEIQLFDASGIKRFIGTVGFPKYTARRTERRQTYTAEGLSWHFRQQMYRQQWKIAAVHPTTGEVTFTQPYLTAVTLFRSLAGAQLTVRAQIKAILDYARDLGIDFTYDLDNLPDVKPPASEQLDLRIFDAIEATLQWCPEVSRSVRYNGGRPHLFFTRAASVHGRRLQAPEDFDVRTFRLSELDEYECTPRGDLLARSMKITYLRPFEVELPDGTFRVPLQLTEDESTVSNGSTVDMESTVKLSPLAWNGTAFVPPDESPSAGLAESLHEGYARLSYELTFGRTTPQVDWAPKCGELFNILEAGPEMESAFTICQSVTRNLASGQMTVRCGLASGLGLSGRLQLLRPNRTRTVPQSGGQQYGFDDDDEKKDGKSCSCECDCCDDSGSGGPIDSGEL